MKNCKVQATAVRHSISLYKSTWGRTTQMSKMMQIVSNATKLKARAIKVVECEIGTLKKVTLFNVGGFFSYEAGINGSLTVCPLPPLYPPPSVSASFYVYLKL